MSTPFETNHSIAGQQLEGATQAVLIAPGAEGQWGYAVLTGTRAQPEIAVYTFATRADMDRALDEAFHGKFLHQKYPDVFVFTPDSLPRGAHGSIEWDDDQLEQALFERASREGAEQ